MGEIALRSEDKIGIAGAILLHVLLAVALVMQVMFAPASRPPPPRVTVNLATEVSLESTAPEPVPESQIALAPELGEVPALENEPEPADAPPEEVQTQQDTRTAPRQTPQDTRDRRRPDPRPTRSPPARRAENTGGSRIDENFLEGRGDSTRTDETRAPSPTFGRRERAALASAITRQLRPHWTAPTGVDADRLVSTVSWRLNEDGSLRGTPSCRTDPNSITTSNRPQAALHCERAIRAVQLAAPFNLPPQFYSRWDDLEWQFDRRL